MNKRTILLFTIVLALILLAWPVYGADIAVNEDCNLADAIKAANTDIVSGGCPAGDGADVITLSDDVLLQKALPLVTSELTVEGGGFSISGNGRTHIFGVNNRGDLTLNMLKLSNGRAGWGGAIGNLGGNLTITGSTVRDNSADRGGAIGNEGTLIINDSVIRDNSADGVGGAIHNLGGNVTIASSSIIYNSSDGSSGGAIYNNDGTVVISDYSVFERNLALYNGGAIYNDDGSVSISESSFNFNKAGTNYSYKGGAIYNYIRWDDDEDEVTIVASTFRNNSATEHGGAIYNCCGNLIITNSTFVSNSAGENGGALFDSTDNVTTIRHSTFFGNSAEEDGGGLYLDSGDTNVNLFSSIVAGNQGNGDCFGRLTENVRSLIEDGSCFAEMSGEPMLGELVQPEDNSTAYIPLLNGSPAIDHIDARNCSTIIDQIGTERPQGESCDIGAIEFVQEQ